MLFAALCDSVAAVSNVSDGWMSSGAEVPSHTHGKAAVASVSTGTAVFSE